MDRALFEKALKEMSQREGLTPEERKWRCGELLVQAQYMDSKEYLRWMNDSTKRPWVGLTDEVIWLEYQRLWPFHPTEEPTLAKDIAKFARAIEAKLLEKTHET